MDAEDPLKTEMNKEGSETWFRRLFAYFLGAQKVLRRRNCGQPKSSITLSFKRKIFKYLRITWSITMIPKTSPTPQPIRGQGARFYPK